MIDLLNFNLTTISTLAFENELSLNVRKSQAIRFHSSQRWTLPLPIWLNNNTISNFDKVCNLRLMIRDIFLWSAQIGTIWCKVYTTLRGLRSVTQFLPVNVPCIPHFLCCEIIFWNSLDAVCRHKLSFAYTRYIHALKKLDPISRFTNSVLGYYLAMNTGHLYS